MSAVEGKWKIIRETEKALFLEREDGIQRWFPKSVVSGPDSNGMMEVADWFLGKEPLPPLETSDLELPAPERGEWRQGAISYSQVSTFRACPRAYYFGRIRRVPSAKRQSQFLGSAVHEALELIYDCDFGTAVPEDYLAALLRRRWNTGKAEFERARRQLGRWDESKFSPALDQARWGVAQATGDFSVESITGRAPPGREKMMFSGDSRIGGIIDVLFTDPELVTVDYKTGKAPEGGLGDDQQLQGLIYSHLVREEYDRLPDRVEFWYLGDTKVTFIPDEAKVAEVAELMHEASDTIDELREMDEGHWEARPSETACKWCDAKPWCSPYQDSISDQIGEGRGNLVRGEVLESLQPEGKRPGSVTIQTGDGELKLKGWGRPGGLLGELLPGQEVQCIDTWISRSEYSGELEGLVSDPYAIIVDGYIKAEK